MNKNIYYENILVSKYWKHLVEITKSYHFFALNTDNFRELPAFFSECTQNACKLSHSKEVLPQNVVYRVCTCKGWAYGKAG